MDDNRQLARWTLPAALRTAPESSPAIPEAAAALEDWLQHEGVKALCGALTPAISAEIARMVRQRRYTP